MKPAVSIVISTFNRGPLVLGAVQSVLAQTWKDYELIVVDDGSTDNTQEILEPYHQRLRYFRQENRGVSAARNKGISLANGEWVSALDSDDEWLPTKLEQQFQALSALGSDFGACFTDCQFSGNLEIRKTAFEFGGLKKSGPFGVLDSPTLYAVARHPVVWIQSLLARRSLIEELGGFDESMILGEDSDLIFRLALKTKFCFVFEPLVKVDRTPSRSVGLMELSYRGDDKAFSSMAYLYQKWLDMPEVTDPQLRAHIRGNLLRTLYYDWMVRKIYQFSLSEAFEKMKRLRKLGDGIWGILLRLAFRAARRTLRFIAWRRDPIFP